MVAPGDVFFHNDVYQSEGGIGHLPDLCVTVPVHHDGQVVAFVQAFALGVYAVLRGDGGFLTMEQILRRLDAPMEVPAFERHLSHLKRDFHIDVDSRKTGDAYRLGAFKAFVGQDDHLRHEAFLHPARIS